MDKESFNSLSLICNTVKINYDERVDPYERLPLAYIVLKYACELKSRVFVEDILDLQKWMLFREPKLYEKLNELLLSNIHRLYATFKCPVSMSITISTPVTNRLNQIKCSFLKTKSLITTLSENNIVISEKILKYIQAWDLFLKQSGLVILPQKMQKQLHFEIPCGFSNELNIPFNLAYYVSGCKNVIRE